MVKLIENITNWQTFVRIPRVTPNKTLSGELTMWSLGQVVLPKLDRS